MYESGRCGFPLGLTHTRFVHMVCDLSESDTPESGSIGVRLSSPAVGARWIGGREVSFA